MLIAIRTLEYQGRGVGGGESVGGKKRKGGKRKEKAMAKHRGFFHPKSACCLGGL